MSNHPLTRWHALVANPDAGALADLLAEDAVFLSPIVHAPQKGKPLVMAYLTAAFRVFGNDSFAYVRQIEGPTDAMLEFETTIDGVQVNGVDIIRWNGDGRIAEFKVMLRPLKAIELVHARMADMLEAMKKAP